GEAVTALRAGRRRPGQAEQGVEVARAQGAADHRAEDVSAQQCHQGQADLLKEGQGFWGEVLVVPPGLQFFHVGLRARSRVGGRGNAQCPRGGKQRERL